MVESVANNVDDIIEEFAARQTGGGRADDKRSETAMEDRKKEGYLEKDFDEHRTKGYLDMDLLRFTTAGSVDDGKSTLIALLYDQIHF